MQLKFTDKANLKHLNVRKTGDDNAKELAIDIKISGKAFAGEWIDKVLGTEPGTAEAHFWTHAQASDEFNQRFTGIDIIKSWAFFHNCKLHFGGLELIGEAKKFEFKPKGEHRADVTFTLAVTDPGERDVNILAEMVQEDAVCSLEFPSDLFSEEAA